MSSGETYLFARESGRALTPYDICKTHVLADVFRVIERGKVVFGGKLYALPYGPVVKQTLDSCERWATDLYLATMLAVNFPPECQPLQPSGWTGQRNHIPEFRATSDYVRANEASWDWSANQETASICKAFQKVTELGSLSTASQQYFHEPISAIGYAYEVATRHVGAMSSPCKSTTGRD